MNFSRWGNARLIQLARPALTAILATNAYSSIHALVSDCQIVLDNFDEALIASVKGSASQIIAKNDLRKKLITAMKAVVENVNRVSAGNRTLLAASKLELTKEEKTPVKLEPVQKFTVIHGNSGEMALAIKKGRGTRTAIFQYTLDNTITPQTRWISEVISLSKFTFTGLPVGKYVSFRVGVTGTRGQVLYTDVVRKMVA